MPPEHGDPWGGWALTNCTSSACTYTTTTGIYTATTTATGTGIMNTEWQIWANQAATVQTAALTTTCTVRALRWLLRGPNLAAAQNARQIQGAPNIPRKKTEREIQRELQIQQDHERAVQRMCELHAAELAAKKRAEALLLENISADQRRDLGERGHFFVTAKSGKRYRIDRHIHGNVYEVNEVGTRVRRYCAQPGGVPADDAILAQKLALETDEAAFLRVANATAV